MKRYRFCYPGDQPALITEMSRAEFLALYPSRTVTLINPLTGETLCYDVGDEIHCDLCNSDPGPTIYLYQIRSVERAYCPACFAVHKRQYCQEIDS